MINKDEPKVYKLSKLNNKLILLLLSFLSLILLSSCSYETTTINLGSGFDSTWTFSNSSDYEFDENFVEVVNGKAQLKVLDLEHSGDDFNSGNHLGSHFFNNNLSILNSKNVDISSILSNYNGFVVGHWSLENDWLDKSNNLLHGQASGANFSPDSQIGFFSGNFNGIDNYVKISNNDKLSGMDKLTISFWTKAIAKSNGDRILTKTDHTGTGLNTSYRFQLSTDLDQKLVFRLYTSDGLANIESDQPLPTSEWTHVVGHYNGSKVQLIINGVLQSDEENLTGTVSSFPESSNELIFGHGDYSVNNNRAYNGLLDEVIILNNSITASDIEAIYYLQSKNYTQLSPLWTPKWNNIVGYWKMDGNWQDSSGAGNHGLASGDAQHSPESKVGALSGLFDGAGDNVQITGPFSSAVSELSVGGWIKVKNFNFYSGINIRTPFISNWNSYSGGSQSGFMLSAFHTISNNRFTVSINDGVNSVALYTEPYSDADFETNFSEKWLHIATTYKSGEYIRIFLNGKMIAERVTGVPLVMSPETTTRLGSTSVNPGVLDGNLDDFAIWSAALSKIEISSIYNRQKQKYASHYDSEVIDLGNATSNWPDLSWSTSLPFGKELVGDFDNDGTPDSESSSDYSLLLPNLSAGLQGYWPMNEQVWTNSPAQVKDLSGNGNDSQSFGMIQSVTGQLNGGGRFSDLATGGDYIDIPNSPKLENVQESNYTLSAWYRPSIVPQGSGADYDTHHGILIKQGRHLGIIYTWNKNFSCLHWQGANDVSQGSTSQFEVENFHHIVCRVDVINGKVEIYVNGQHEGTSNFVPGATFEYGTQNWRIGAATSGTVSFGWPSIGIIDEVSIWSRFLSDTEIQQLYRRGANRVKLQVKSCVDSSCNCKSYGAGGSETDCDGDTILNTADTDDIHKSEFIGPGGDGTTYYSELYNRTNTEVTFNCALNITDSDAGVCAPDEITLTAGPKPTGPEFLNIDYTQFVTPQANRYAQYRVYMEADENTACGGEPCLPELTRVSLNPTGATRYSSEYIKIKPKSPITFTKLLSAEIDAETCATFRLSRSNTEYYYDGASWVPATADAHRNPASVVESNITKFAIDHGVGELEVNTYLSSDVSQSTQCSVNSIDVKYE